MLFTNNILCIVYSDHHFETPLYQELYQTLFKGDGICARDIDYVDAVAAVKAIKADNGYAVLAHPGQLDSYDLIPELVKNGLDGIERDHLDHSTEDRSKEWIGYADEYALFQNRWKRFSWRLWHTDMIGELVSPTELLEAVLPK